MDEEADEKVSKEKLNIAAKALEKLQETDIKIKETTVISVVSIADTIGTNTGVD